MIYPKDEFFISCFRYIELCGECLNDWKLQTERGKLVDDEAFDPSMNITKIELDEETAAQCEGCNKQSDNYDDVVLG